VSLQPLSQVAEVEQAGVFQLGLQIASVYQKNGTLQGLSYNLPHVQRSVCQRSPVIESIVSVIS